MVKGSIKQLQKVVRFNWGMHLIHNIYGIFVLYLWCSSEGIITACNEVGARYYFQKHVSRILFRGGAGVVSQHASQVPGPHPGGSWGVWPGVGLQAHTHGGSWGVWPGGSPGPHPGCNWGVWPGGVSRPTPGMYPSMHWGRHPPRRRLLLRAVRILLECILVSSMLLCEWY